MWHMWTWNRRQLTGKWHHQALSAPTPTSPASQPLVELDRKTVVPTVLLSRVWVSVAVFLYLSHILIHGVSPTLCLAPSPHFWPHLQPLPLTSAPTPPPRPSPPTFSSQFTSSQSPISLTLYNLSINPAEESRDSRNILISRHYWN